MTRRLSTTTQLVLLHLAAGLVFLRPGYIRPDSVGVFAWLRSAVLDGDLLFFNEWERFGMISGGVPLFKEVTPVGALANHWWIGASLLNAPAYLLARAIGAVAPALRGDGFSRLDGTVLAWMSVACGLAVSIFALRLLRELAPGLSRAMRALAIVAPWIGTPLFWYALRQPLGTHLAGAASVGLLCLLLFRGDAPEERWLGAATGLALGMAAACRLQHLVLLPAVLAATALRRRRAQFYLTFCAGLALPLAVQGIAWAVVYGTPFGPLARGALASGATWSPFHRLAFGEVLASSWHGLFTWCPVLIPAVAGWLMGLRRRRAEALSLLLAFAGEWLVCATFDRFWWGGMSFGPRRFVDLAVPFAIGLGWCAEALRPRVAAGLLLLPAAWTGVLAVAAATDALDLSADPGFRGLLAAALAGLRGIPALPGALHSPVVDPRLLGLSLVAVAVLTGLGLAVRAAARARGILVVVSAALIALAGVGVAATWGPTRQRADAEIARLKLDRPRAAVAGPLLDAKGLLQLEADHYRRIGASAREASILAEIRALDERLAGLGPGPTSGP